MGPRALRATSRKASSELPETARANFLTSAAQLVSVSLPQLSTHLGQQALKYIDAQQVLLSSVTARSQLCKKCGSPLNPQTCSYVHVAWLSAATSERLSKRLAGSSAAAARTRASSSSSRDKLVNRVVAVRRCMLCQEPSVRPFLSVHLAQQQLGREGFADVEVRGPDPLQQAEARRVRRQAQRHEQEQQKFQQREQQQDQPTQLVQNSPHAPQSLQQQQQPQQQGPQQGPQQGQQQGPQQGQQQHQQPELQPQQQRHPLNKRTLQFASEDDADAGTKQMLPPAKRAALDLQPAAAAAAAPDPIVPIPGDYVVVPQEQNQAAALGGTRADGSGDPTGAAAGAVVGQSGHEKVVNLQQLQQQGQGQHQQHQQAEPQRQQEQEQEQAEHHQPGKSVVAYAAVAALARTAAVTSYGEIIPMQDQLAADNTEETMATPANVVAAAATAGSDQAPQLLEGPSNAADLPAAAAAATSQPAVPQAAAASASAEGVLPGAELGSACITEPSAVTDPMHMQPQQMQLPVQQQLEFLPNGEAAGHASSASVVAPGVNTLRAAAATAAAQHVEAAEEDLNVSEARVLAAAPVESLPAQPAPADTAAAVAAPAPATVIAAAAAADTAAAVAAPAPAPAPAPPAVALVAPIADAPKVSLLEIPPTKGVQVAHITPRPLAGPTPKPPAAAAAASAVRSWPLCPTALVSSSHSSWALQPPGGAAAPQQQQQLVVITEDSWVTDMLAEGGNGGGNAGGAAAVGHGAIAGMGDAPVDAAAAAEAVAANAPAVMEAAAGPGAEARVQSIPSVTPPSSTAGPSIAGNASDGPATAAVEICAAEVPEAAAVLFAGEVPEAAAATAAAGSEEEGAQVISTGVSYHGPWAIGGRPAGAGGADSDSQSWGGGMSGGSMSVGSVGPAGSHSSVPEQEQSEAVDSESSEGMTEEDQHRSQVGGGESEMQQEQQQVQDVVYSIGGEGVSGSGGVPDRAQQAPKDTNVGARRGQHQPMQQQQQGAVMAMATRRQSSAGEQQELAQVGPQGMVADGNVVLQQGRGAGTHTAVTARAVKRQRKEAGPDRVQSAGDGPLPQQQLPDKGGADGADNSSDCSPVAAAAHAQQQGVGGMRGMSVAAQRGQQDVSRQRSSRKGKGDAQQGSQRAIRAFAVQQHLLHKSVGRKFLRHLAYRM